MKKKVSPFPIFSRRSIVMLFFLLFLNSFYAQIKIGDNPQNIDINSLFELESSDKAMVLSRISTAQMQAITPLPGAIIYNIEEECVFYYNGSNWVNLCRDSNGFSIIDNGNNTYTVNDGTNPEFTFSTNSETVTSISQNTDGTYTYTNEAGEQTIIATGTSTFSIIDNGDGSYTVNDGTNPEFTFSTNSETVTNIVQNTDGTFTYTNEAGIETIIANGTGTSSLSITDNGDNTFTVNDGPNPAFTITATPETVTSLTQNADGTYTYENENSEQTVITPNPLSIVNNEDGTFTVDDGTNTAFTITATPETITSLTQNADGTYTYENEDSEQTVITPNPLSIVNNEDGTFTVDDGTNPAFTITTAPETITSLTQNADGTYTYENEDSEQTVITPNPLSILDNGDDTFTVNDGTNPAFTITATPETVTSLTQNADGTYTYENEDSEQTIITPNPLSIVDNGDNTFTVDDGTNPAFTITAPPETTSTLTENNNGTYTYENEDGDETIISFGGSSTEGSVFFSDDASGLIENNAQFFWDNANERLGLGTNTNLTDKLTLNGTLGISDGSEANPSYRFSADPDTGIFRSNDDELGFAVGGIPSLKLAPKTLFVNNALPDYGRVGINTKDPQTALHVVGGMRVTILPPAQANESFVTVDSQGNFHKSEGSQPVVTGGGRWTNAALPLSLNSGLAIIPIFDSEDYNDGSSEFYEPNSNILTIKSDGRYVIGATISLIGNVRTDGTPGNTWARISINGLDQGAFHVAANSGATGGIIYSSINIRDVLNLQANDAIRIKLFSDANPASLLFVGPETSSFTIMKL